MYGVARHPGNAECSYIRHNMTKKERGGGKREGGDSRSHRERSRERYDSKEHN